MQLFTSPGIRDALAPLRAGTFRWPRFGPRRTPAPPSPDRIEADVAACVLALTRVHPARWEDVLASCDRAA